MKKKVVALVLLVVMSGCTSKALDIYGMPHAPKYGPPEYIQGWKEGCQTGMTSYGSYYLRYRYRANVNGSMMANPMYSKGWELGANYCQYYASTYLANKEFSKGDLRADNTWFSMKSDGFFTYKGIEKVDFLPFN